MNNPDTTEAQARHSPLEAVAMTALDAGRLMMEAGASAHQVDAIVIRIARALGSERHDLRIGYASIAVTIGIGGESITRMCKVGHIGVNAALDRAVRTLAVRVEKEQLSIQTTRSELARLVHETRRHHPLLTACAVGLACAAFSRLFKADWAAVGSVFAGATIAQLARHAMARCQINVFIATSVVAFIGSAAAGFGARFLGSQTVPPAMIAAILLLVPGVPLLNAQNDILNGRPTLGSARLVWVAVILIFATVGLWLGQMLLQEGH